MEVGSLVLAVEQYSEPWEQCKMRAKSTEVPASRRNLTVTLALICGACVASSCGGIVSVIYK